MSEYITIVSGLPRSGTSLMMKMLEAGGMAVVVDNVRTADEDNPRGYYEFEKVKDIKEDISWIEDVRGKTVKMVSMLLYSLPPEHRYSLIFMRRKMPEILASQKVMLRRKGEDLDEKEMEKLYNIHLDKIRKWLDSQSNIRVLSVNYNDLIENPRENIERLCDFLGTKLDVHTMTAMVDDSLYRQRSQQDVTAQSEQPGEMSGQTDMTDEEREKIEDRLKALGYM